VAAASWFRAPCGTWIACSRAGVVEDAPRVGLSMRTSWRVPSKRTLVVRTRPPREGAGASSWRRRSFAPAAPACAWPWGSVRDGSPRSVPPAEGARICESPQRGAPVGARRSRRCLRRCAVRVTPGSAGAAGQGSRIAGARSISEGLLQRTTCGQAAVRPTPPHWPTATGIGAVGGFLRCTRR
jgi:hypothetical protein